MLFRQEAAVHFQNHTKLMNALCGQNTGLLILYWVVQSITTTTFFKVIESSYLLMSQIVCE
jgi:hypothetical protein